MLRQARALLALKWTLVRRTWHAGRWLSLALLVRVTLSGASLSLAATVGLYFLGGPVVSADPPTGGLLLLDILVFGYVFLWFWGLLMEVQRADVIDIRRLLHLPVSLSTAYLLNFFASLAGPLLLFSLPCFAGLLLGLAHAAGPRAALAGVPLVLLFLLLFGAWAYYLRGWLAVLMENKRRRRIVMTVIPLCLIVMGQLPAILSHAARMGREESVDDALAEQRVQGWIESAHTLLPPAWLSLGLWSLVHDRPATAAAAGSGLAGGALLGLALGYRVTIRYYTGAGIRLLKKQAATGPTRLPATLRSLPFVADDTAGLAWAFLLSYWRHPHMRLQIITPIGFGVFLMFMYRSGAYGAPNPNPAWLPTAMLAWPFLSFGLYLFNQFGGDGASFRGLVLLPIPRHRILAAKHIALFPIVGGLTAGLILAGVALAGVGAYTACLALLLGLVLYLTFCALGSWMSVFFPYRFGHDALRGHGDRSMTLLMGLASLVLLSLVLMPAGLCLSLDRFAPLSWPSQLPPPSLVAALLWLCLAGMLYRYSLIHAGDLLLLREPRVLAAILRERGE